LVGGGATAETRVFCHSGCGASAAAASAPAIDGARARLE
jgi:hypothetical protein